MKRTTAPELDKVLGRRFSALDDGFVRAIDYLGTDESIVQAARVSYGAGTKTRQTDKNLLRYLLRHGHTTPFEMCELKIHVRAPMDVWRQWIRHRTASVNEYSTRYSVAIEATARTDANAWRLQSSRNRQGSGAFLDSASGLRLTAAETGLLETSRSVYTERLNAGVAREQARKDLPLSTYTEAYWKIDLHNLLGFLRLRLSADAQLEIRTYANLIATEIVRRWVPWTWEAFQDYVVRGVTLSSREVAVIRALNGGTESEAKRLAVEYGWLSEGLMPVGDNRERRQAAERILRLGISVPWLGDESG